MTSTNRISAFSPKCCFTASQGTPGTVFPCSKRSPFFTLKGNGQYLYMKLMLKGRINPAIFLNLRLLRKSYRGLTVLFLKHSSALPSVLLYS